MSKTGIVTPYQVEEEWGSDPSSHVQNRWRRPRKGPGRVTNFLKCCEETEDKTGTGNHTRTEEIQTRSRAKYDAPGQRLCIRFVFLFGFP